MLFGVKDTSTLAQPAAGTLTLVEKAFRMKAGLCTDFAAWVFSSYAALIGYETTALQREEV